MDAVKALTATVGVVADLLGKKQTELLDALKDGENYLSPEEVKSYLKPLVDAKVKALVPSDKVEQARGKARKDVMTELETKISEKFGVTGLLKDDLLDKVFALTEKPNALSADDVTGSKVYKDLLKAHKTEIRNLKTDHAKELKTEKVGRVKDRLFDEALAYIKDDKNNFVIPEDSGILEKQVRNIVSEIMSYKHGDEDTVVKIVDNKLTIRDKDNLTLKDDQHNDLGVFNVVRSVTTAGYFPTKAASGRNTPPTTPGGPGETTTIKFGKDKSIEVPSFSDASAMNTYLLNDGAALSPEERVAIRKAHEGKFNED